MSPFTLLDTYNNSSADSAVVDLGLPSGILWTTKNIGAENPWDYCNHYAWGETSPKENYDWSTYKHAKGGSYAFTKYCNDGGYGYAGFTDTLTILEPTDDAATVNLGVDYKTPTKTDFEELHNNCYWVWTDNYADHNVKVYIVYKAKTDDDKGVKCYKGGVVKANYTLTDAHIFLPTAGYRSDSNLYHDGSNGSYWSSSLDADDTDDACNCLFNSDEVYKGSGIRIVGLSVRAVRRK